MPRPELVLGSTVLQPLRFEVCALFFGGATKGHDEIETGKMGGVE